MAPAPPCLTCVWRMRGARWGAKWLKIKGFSSDVRSRKRTNRPIHRRIRIVRTAQGFMHIYTHTPLSAYTHSTPLYAMHIAPPACITSRQAHTVAHHVALYASREAVLLIRSTLPMSNVADSFSLRKAILGPSEDNNEGDYNNETSR